MNDINDRIKELIDNYSEGNAAKFSIMISEKPSRLDSIIGKRKVVPGGDLLQHICFTFEEVNGDWLLTGKGQMKKDRVKGPDKIRETATAKAIQGLDTLKERLKFYLAYKNITQQEFTEKAQVSSGFINMMNDNIRGGNIKKIVRIFPNINLHWLFFGEGEMERDSRSETELKEEIERLKVQNQVYSGIIEFAQKLLKEKLSI